MDGQSLSVLEVVGYGAHRSVFFNSPFRVFRPKISQSLIKGWEMNPIDYPYHERFESRSFGLLKVREGRDKKEPEGREAMYSDEAGWRRIRLRQ